ncbi:MAG: hypothetical protein GXP45_06375 [bacterium]|nr:hypothetical protein [bacterium]
MGSPSYMQVLLSELYAPAVVKVVNEIGSANAIFLLKRVDRDILLTYLNSDDETVGEFIKKTKLYLRKHDLNTFVNFVNTKHRLPRR